MLEPGAFGGRRGTAQRLQSSINLNRVARDGDGLLAVFLEDFGRFDRDGRLSDRRRPEDRENL